MSILTALCSSVGSISDSSLVDLIISDLSDDGLLITSFVFTSKESLVLSDRGDVIFR